MTPIRIALAQINPTVGDLRANADRILDFARRAQELRADVVAFPELALLGYPPEDLLFKRGFLADSWALLEEVAQAADGATFIVGAAEFTDGEPFHPGAAPYPGDAQGRVYNAAAILHDRRIAAVYRKTMLPNYGVFDEERYFAPGEECPVYEINGAQIAVNVCEDIWRDPGPAAVQRLAGAQVVVNINASPYHRGRGEQRREMLAKRARGHRCFIAYVNMTGGQDELVFDGQSVAFDPDGQLIARAPQFEEALLVFDLDPGAAGPPDAGALRAKPGLDALGPPRRVFLSAAPAASAAPRDPAAPSVAPELHPLSEVHRALVTGTRDYVRKSGFSRAVVGLSGGVDSALTLAIAAEALGPNNVSAYFMPSQYTSGQSGDDARALAANLGVRLAVIPIRPVFDAYADALAPEFGDAPPGVAEENLQARVRGNLLMAASNKFGWIVLTTGNKSEMATGYATLYGDMAGGFAVIKDVPKTLVFQLARHLNETAGREIIPNAIIIRPPTAELRPDQKDEDSLPPYDVLDPILEAYVENDRSRGEMIAGGMPPGAVDLAASLVDRSEYKRRQAPPGVKITRRNFGRDRRLPIVNRYRPR